MEDGPCYKGNFPDLAEFGLHKRLLGPPMSQSGGGQLGRRSRSRRCANGGGNAFTTGRNVDLIDRSGKARMARPRVPPPQGRRPRRTAPRAAPPSPSNGRGRAPSGATTLGVLELRGKPSMHTNVDNECAMALFPSTNPTAGRGFAPGRCIDSASQMPSKPTKTSL